MFGKGKDKDAEKASKKEAKKAAKGSSDGKSGLMGTVVKTLSRLSPVGLGILELAVAALLLINPSVFMNVIVTGAGVVLLVIAALAAIRYFRAPVAVAAKEQNLVKAAVAAILGGFCLCQFLWIDDAMPILSVVFGVCILLGAAVRTQWAVDLLRLGRRYWYVVAANAAIAYIMGALILANPFAELAVLWRCIAITLIVTAVVDVIAAFIVDVPKQGKTAPAAPVAAVAPVPAPTAESEAASEPAPAPAAASAAAPAGETPAAVAAGTGDADPGCASPTVQPAAADANPADAQK